MKKLSTIVAIVAAMLICLSAGAQEKRYINYFSVSSSIKQPVTMETNQGTYTFYNSYTVYGHISRVTARDADGNLIVNNQPKKSSLHSDAGKPDEYWYVFSDIYPGTGNSSSSGSGSSYGSSSYSRSTYGSRGMDLLADRFWENVFDEEFDCKIYASAGYGTKYGSTWGANITVKPWMGVIGLSAGYGRDPRYEDTFYSSGKEGSWYLATSFGFQNFGIVLGVNNRYYPETYSYEKGLVMSFDFNFPIYGNWGIDTNFGVGLQFKEHGSAAFEWGIGLTYTLFCE